MTTRMLEFPCQGRRPLRWLGMLLLVSWLSGCAHAPPPASPPPPRFTAQQVAALRGQGFTEQADGDWSFGLSDRMLFHSDNSRLLPERLLALRHLAASLLAVGIQHLRVDGYTDSMGSVAHNLDLSRRRAQAVADALIAAGMPATDISIRSMGASHPVADNRTPSGRAENRRAVLVVSSP